MRKTLTAAVLMLALGCPVFAGVIHTPAPAPPPQNVVQEPTVAGEIHTPLTVEETTTAEAVMSVFTSLLALL